MTYPWDLDRHSAPLTVLGVRPLFEDLSRLGTATEEEARKTIWSPVELAREGVPMPFTPHAVAMLIAWFSRVGETLQLEILRAMEELTCGRDAETYSTEQARWRREAVFELLLGFRLWGAALEYGSEACAREALLLIAYCGEEFPECGAAARHVLGRLSERFPSLADHVDAALRYLR